MSDVYYSLYPHGLPTETVRLLDGTRLHYRTSEEGQIPIILVHGYSLSSVIWEKVQILFPPRYRTFAPDLRGFGLSDKPEEGYGYHELAEDLAQFLRALKIRQAVFVGHGFGANIIQHFATKYPDRVLGLVLVNSSALYLPTFGIDDELRKRIDDYGSKDANELVLRQTLPHYFDGDKVSKEDLEHFVTVGCMASTMALVKTLEVMHTAEPLEREKYDLLKMPTLIIIGAHDPFCSFQQAVALSDVLPKSRIMVMARCGHSPMWEKPIEFVKAVTEFLGEAGLK